MFQSCTKQYVDMKMSRKLMSYICVSLH